MSIIFNTFLISPSCDTQARSAKEANGRCLIFCLSFSMHSYSHHGVFMTLFRRQLFTSRNENDPYLAQTGNDDSRASCFNACYLWWLEHKDDISMDRPCCMYEKLNSNTERRCQAGIEGRTNIGDTQTSATTSFVEDFDAIANLKEAGKSCSKDNECYSGLCDGGKCKVDCDADSKCYPATIQPYQKCNGNDDSCLNMGGSYHYCDIDTDTCMSCGGTPSSGFTDVLEDGKTYTFRTSGGGKWWHMQGDGSSHRLDARNWDQENQFEFKYDVSYKSSRGMAAYNPIRNRHMDRDGGKRKQKDNLYHVHF